MQIKKYCIEKANSVLDNETLLSFRVSPPCWIQRYLVKNNSAMETMKCPQGFMNPTVKPRRVYTDNSMEKPFTELNGTHDISTPHRHQTNGTAERAVRRVKEGTGGTKQWNALACKQRDNLAEIFARRGKRREFKTTILQYTSLGGRGEVEGPEIAVSPDDTWMSQSSWTAETEKNTKTAESARSAAFKSKHDAQVYGPACACSKPWRVPPAWKVFTKMPQSLSDVLPLTAPEE